MTASSALLRQCSSVMNLRRPTTPPLHHKIILRSVITSMRLLHHHPAAHNLHLDNLVPCHVRLELDPTEFQDGTITQSADVVSCSIGPVAVETETISRRSRRANRPAKSIRALRTRNRAWAPSNCPASFSTRIPGFASNSSILAPAGIAITSRRLKSVKHSVQKARIHVPLPVVQHYLRVLRVRDVVLEAIATSEPRHRPPCAAPSRRPSIDANNR